MFVQRGDRRSWLCLPDCGGSGQQELYGVFGRGDAAQSDDRKS